jgi:hypothetical protein
MTIKPNSTIGTSSTIPSFLDLIIQRKLTKNAIYVFTLSKIFRLNADQINNYVKYYPLLGRYSVQGTIQEKAFWNYSA